MIRFSRGHLLVVLVLYSVALGAASVAPVSEVAPLAATSAQRMVNNLLHVPAYALLAWLWIRTFRAYGRRPRAVRPVLAGGAAASAFGCLTEISQLLVPGRMCTVGDALLNGFGAGGAALLLWAWDRRRRTASENSQDVTARAESAGGPNA